MLCLQNQKIFSNAKFVTISKYSRMQKIQNNFICKERNATSVLTSKPMLSKKREAIVPLFDLSESKWCWSRTTDEKNTKVKNVKCYYWKNINWNFQGKWLNSVFSFEVSHVTFKMWFVTSSPFNISNNS